MMGYLRREMEKIIAIDVARKERDHRHIETYFPLKPHVETMGERPKLDLPEGVTINPSGFTP